MTNKKLAILGASGHGKVVAEIAECNGYKVVFYDDAFPEKSKLEHWQVLGGTQDLLDSLSDFDGIAVGIGNNYIRADKINLLISAQAHLITLVHPQAIVSEYSRLGNGTVVMAGAIINPFVQIGSGAIVNTGAVVEHDCHVGDFCHISPNAALAGECKIGEKTWIGLGSNIRQQINIGAGVVIGAGSVVVKDIPVGSKAFGNPAKVKKG